MRLDWNRRLLLTVLAVLVAPAIFAQSSLDGVAVESIWRAANLLNPNWISDELAFVPADDGFTATTEFGARQPDAGTGTGMTVGWEIRRVGDAPPSMSSFTIPSTAQFVVIGEYTFRDRTVRTYSTADELAGSVVATCLGYSRTDGSIVSRKNCHAGEVFAELGVAGPHVNTISIDAGGKRTVD